MTLTATSTKRRHWMGIPLNVIISSPSGGGKSTVIRRLRRKHPEFMYSLSVTTRKKRKGERDGVHYHFIAPDEFQELIDRDELLEWAEVHGERYGTPRANVAEAYRRKRILLFDIDVQGAASLKHSEPSAVSIFLLPPSWSVLKQRLEARGSETTARLKKRLETARWELTRISEYDYWITNDQLSACVTDCETVIRAELLTRERQRDFGRIDKRLLTDK
ncbi:MAG: guanylate kinase [candidate division Zixibacteria bacterium]|nr:guanylate kinase [candidate division Zixibacteria bacterium]